MKTIVLNGTSSSGKTSIATSIQRQADVPVLHASLDTFTDMFDWSTVPENRRSECHKIGLSNFHTFLGNLPKCEILLVVDHVFERIEWFEDCLAALATREIFLVGVHCPLKILEQRERFRGDRRIGLARSQFDTIHERKKYDLELNTSLENPEQCAKRILNEFPRNS